MKTRVVSALDHLGHQTLSNEPGGYDLQSWVKSLNLLLDDFQDKVGPSKLPPEYYAKRSELAEELFKQLDVAKIDGEIETLRREAEEKKDTIEKERQRITDRIAAIGSEKNKDAQALEDARREARELEERRASSSFFSRLLGRNRDSSDAAQRLVAKLEADLKGLETEMATQQASLDSLAPAGVSQDAGSETSLPHRLYEIQARLTELGVQREQKMQLSQERESLTTEFAKMISGVPGAGTPAEGQPAQATPS